MAPFPACPRVEGEGPTRYGPAFVADPQHECLLVLRLNTTTTKQGHDESSLLWTEEANALDSAPFAVETLYTEYSV